jgi:hypothetical protein
MLVVGLSSSIGIAGAGAGASPARTLILTFKPFDRTGLRHGVTVVSRAAGHCWTGSISNSEAYVWRCLRANLIYDPCFSSPYQRGLGYVACPLYSKGSEEPSRLLELRLTSPLPAKGDDPRVGTQGAWWLIRLHNGVECLKADGAASFVKGVPAVYVCDGGGIAGQPSQAAEPWRVRYVAKGARTAATEVVVVASDG